ncbi:hypothetical protein [Streptomyces sp. WZ-12]|uniref:hypothetical protein n=1 Tax=Streptomyces sp. WZ-12 TaxID=3030210 RepID=UPI002380CC9F|nr:hypothetical protein [Streptomyces sp. WZ-12]
MSPHQSAPTPAAGRAEQEARRAAPTMNELLAACAAATAVSTPPDVAEGPRAEKEKAGERHDVGESAGQASAPSTPGRDAA